MKTTVASVLAAGLATALILAGAAPASRQTRGARLGAEVVVSTRTVPKLGTVLVDRGGRTLYMFVPDKRRKVTCLGACAALWPPVRLPKAAKLLAAGKARGSLLGSDRDPAGGRVVTYNHWPLYRYVGDRAPGQASGQALNLNGGLWYVLTPAGKIIRRKP